MKQKQIIIVTEERRCEEQKTERKVEKDINKEVRIYKRRKGKEKKLRKSNTERAKRK